MVNTKFK